MRHLHKLCLALLVVSLTQGGGAAAIVEDDRAESVAAAPRALPLAGETPLLAGRYASSRFRPGFSFTVKTDTWRVAHDRERDLVLMSGSACCGMNANDRTGLLAFLRPAAVYSPGGSLLAVPADLVGWLRRNPHLRSSPPTPIAVGGVSGTQLDVSFASATVLGGCAHLLRVSFGVVRLCPGERARFGVLRVNGKPLLIMSRAFPSSAAKAFRPTAKGLLGSVRFGVVRARVAARTLVLGNSDPTNDDALFFAREVARRTGGTLWISLRSGLYDGSPVAEEIVVRDLRAGRLALAWDAARVWESQGVTSFQALQAPFLIDSYALLERVITGPPADELLSGPSRVGVVGLGLAAVNLRRPLGVRKPFVSLADFRGARINVFPSGVGEATVRALGAQPLNLGGGNALAEALRGGQADAAETGIDVVYRNGYARVAKYVTGNLILFPKVASIDISKDVFDALTTGEQTALREAARATAAHSLASAAARDDADAAALCRSGLRFATATPSSLSELVAATRHVYSQLAQAPLAARLIEQIAALKQRTAPGAGLAVPAGCSV